jgi:glyoxylase-like metal-dependent hydrolase (beta-lactamase superfamily II)
MANSYVLLSESGKALLIDFGYDFMTGAASGADRASRRPWLYTLGALKRDFGVQQIEAAIPTHYHDDHVAGLNVLREVEGTQVWAAESFADILEHPSWYDLPCLWYDPIPVDQVLPVETPLVWNEYELTLHRLPGHTQYAVAIDFRVDGRRVVATGDQYQSVTGLKWNYVYQNRFRSEDYRLSAELLCRLRPDLVISGHWDPIWVTPEYLQDLMARGEALERLHRELLPQEVTGLGAEGFGARIQPYQAQTRAGEPVTLAVEVHNPFASQELVVVRLAAPVGWLVEPPEIHATLGACEATLVQFNATPPAGLKIRRARLAADLTVGGRRFGQQAETLITVV